MIIVSGKIIVDSQDRASYLEGCREVIELARKSPGCLDFHLSADPIENGRINVYEQWETVEDVETVSTIQCVVAVEPLDVVVPTRTYQRVV